MRGGLRTRLIGSLLLIAIVTLGTTAALVLSPLEARIRADEIENIKQEVRLGRTLLASLDREQIRPGSPALRRAVKTLKARVGGDIAIVRLPDAVLAATDFDTLIRFADVARAVGERRTVDTIAGSGGRASAQIAVPLVIDGTQVTIVAAQRLNDATDAVLVVRRAFFGAAVISLGIALLLGLWLARRLVLRLRALRDAALRVAELGPVVEIKADAERDEVGDLTRALVTMQNRLREQEQARRTFVATASHELRTPLASLRVLLDLLRDDLERDAPDVEDARRQAARADEQAERLGGLASDLLDLSRLDADLPLRRELLDLREVTRAVVTEFADRAAQTNAPLELLAPDPVWAVGDPGAVAQTLRILFDNAVRHAPPGEAITATVALDGERAAVLVRNGGGRIADADRERIFERFERGDATAPGFGLGLPIGRELATRMDATLTLEDGDEAGVGFRLSLPPAPGGA